MAQFLSWLSNINVQVLFISMYDISFDIAQMQNDLNADLLFNGSSN